MHREDVTTARTALSDQEAVQLLHDLIARPSLSGQEGPTVDYLVMAMRRLGMQAHVDASGNAVGMIGEGAPEIVLLGHIDTVAGEIPPRMEDGRLYGRGAVDAKGPLAAFVIAAARLGIAGITGRVVVIGCVEEEAPSSRGAHGAVADYRPDFCVVGEPSGVDTLTLGYKGSLRARLRVEQACGHSAHNRSTVAEAGIEVWGRIQQWAAEANTGHERAWDQVLPALVGIQSGGDGLREWCELEVSIRVPEELDPLTVEQRLRALAPGAVITVLGAVPAFRGSRSTPLARALVGAIREQSMTPRFVVKTGTSDMNVVGPAWNCPILTYGPGDSNLDHTPDEHIVIDEYLASIRILERAMTRILLASPAGVSGY